MSNITKSGIVSSSIFIEEENIPRIGNEINNNVLTGNVIIYTNSSGTISSSSTIGSLSGETVLSLVGKTLCFSYEVNCVGTRYSTEQGQTAWQQTRYGIHGTCSGTNSSGTTTAFYPFASYLNYTGSYQRVVQTWTVPSGYTSFSQLAFAVQNFDKPASTNKEIWFIRNTKLEIADHVTPYILNDAINNNHNDWFAMKEFIEI